MRSIKLPIPPPTTKEAANKKSLFLVFLINTIYRIESIAKTEVTIKKYLPPQNILNAAPKFLTYVISKNGKKVLTISDSGTLFRTKNLAEKSNIGIKKTKIKKHNINIHPNQISFKGKEAKRKMHLNSLLLIFI